MLKSRPEQFERALHALGIGLGDGLLIHSSLQMLGDPVGGVAMYREVLQKTIGSEGTLVVPSFTLDFPQTREFDPSNTPSKGMGSFTEHIRLQPGAMRTMHPMQSLASLGRYAADLAGRDTRSAFEKGSAFERMIDLDFKLFLLGADVQAVSMVHYCETRAKVPYRSWKDFSGRIRLEGDWQERTYRMYARDLEIDPILDLKPIRQAMITKGLWSEIDYNYGRLAACKLKDFINITDALLAEDGWALVGNQQQAKDRYRE